MVHSFDLHERQDFHAALATGDALVLSAALGGGCVYDLLNRPHCGERQEDTRKFLIISAVIAALGAALWFGDMHNNSSHAKDGAPWTLLYLFVTIAICVRALYLAYEIESVPPARREKEPEEVSTEAPGA
jgi:hypothetical protein